MTKLINPIPVPSTGSLQGSTVAPYHFTIKNVFAEAWQRVKGSKSTYWGALLLYIFIHAAIFAVGLFATYGLIGSLNTALPAVMRTITITRLLSALLTLPLTIGICLLDVRWSANLPIKVKQVFIAYKYYWKLFVALFITYGIAFTMAILTFLIVGLLKVIAEKNYGIMPGWFNIVFVLAGVLGGSITLYLLGGFMFVPLLIIEKHLGIFKAIKVSFSGFTQHGFKIIAVTILTFLICLISALPLFIGLIWTVPLMLNCSGILISYNIWR